MTFFRSKGKRLVTAAAAAWRMIATASCVRSHDDHLSRNAEVCDERRRLSNSADASPSRDLARHDECVRLAGAAHAAVGPLTSSVITPAPRGAPVDTSITAWDKVLDVNLKGVSTDPGPPRPLRKAATSDAPARIINIARWTESTRRAGSRGPRRPTLFGEQGGVAPSDPSARRKTGPDHITVNCHRTGPFETKMMAHTLADHAPSCTASRSAPRRRDLPGRHLPRFGCRAWITAWCCPSMGHRHSCRCRPARTMRQRVELPLLSAGEEGKHESDAEKLATAREMVDAWNAMTGRGARVVRPNAPPLNDGAEATVGASRSAQDLQHSPKCNEIRIDCTTPVITEQCSWSARQLRVHAEQARCLSSVLEIETGWSPSGASTTTGVPAARTGAERDFADDL